MDSEALGMQGGVITSSIGGGGRVAQDFYMVRVKTYKNPEIN